jgi:iron(III) transport system ATP-binding protein
VFWRVTLPLIGPGLAAAFCLVFLESATELTATLVLIPTNAETLATQFWAYQTNLAYSQAAPYAGVIMLIAAVPSYVLGRWFDRLPARGAPGEAVRPAPHQAQWWSCEEPVHCRGGQGVRRPVRAVRRRPRGSGGSFTAILGRRAAARPRCCGSSPDSNGPTPARSGWVSVVDDADHRFVPCERRRIGYVPQEGALFPHLNVGRNVAFGLAREDRRGTRVGELLELVGLAGMARRYPHQLSGGQQQRVALARALATGPDIVLLDEPFSSLDASLRASVRADVHDVLRQSGTTSILVTHDQDEALSMADQVAILRGGVIAQINTPSGLYRLPRDAELAQFLGEANLVEGTASGTTVQTALGVLEMAPARPQRTRAAPAGPGRGRRNRRRVRVRAPEQPVRVMVVPSSSSLDESGAGGVPSVVRSYEYFGHDAVVRVQPDNAGLPELVVRITGGPPRSRHPGRPLGARCRRGLAVGRPEALSAESPSGKKRITHA